MAGSPPGANGRWSPQEAAGRSLVPGKSGAPLPGFRQLAKAAGGSQAALAEQENGGAEGSTDLEDDSEDSGFEEAPGEPFGLEPPTEPPLSADSAGVQEEPPGVKGMLAGAWLSFCGYFYPLRGGASATSKTPRLEALDAPRWIASVQIVMYHMYEHEPWFEPVSRWCAMWTQLFFLLSGFVLAYAELARPVGKGRLSVLQFVRRRLTVIYPAYLFSLLLILAGAAPSRTHTAFEWQCLPLHVLLLQAWMPICAMEEWGPSCTSWQWNGESWFLSVLMLYWLLLRPLAESFRSRSACTCLVVIVLCWAFSLVFQLLGHNNRLAESVGCGEDWLCISVLEVWMRAGPLGYLHVFLAGVAAARLFICVATVDSESGGPVLPGTKQVALHPAGAPMLLKVGCLLGYGAFALLVWLARSTAVDYYYFYHNGGLIPIMLLVLVGAAVGQDPLTVWLFRCKPMIVLGRVSYVQYLMQHVVYWWVVGAFGWDGNSAAKVWFLPLLVAFAYLCQRFVERPYTEFQRSRQERGVKGCDDRCIARLDSLLDRCWRCCQR